MCFKNLLSKAFCAFAGAALIVAGCDKAQTPPTTNDDDKPQETVNHFTVTLTDITTTSCIVSIDKDDDDQLFYYAIVRKPSFEEFGKTFQERARAYYEGEIEFYINDFYYTREEAVAEVTSGIDLEDVTVTWLYGDTDYVLIVGYITNDGNPAGDFECVEFNTEAPDASDNKLEIKVSDIGARSAHISVTATNSDQYAVQYFPASQFGDLSGDELAREMLYYYVYWPDILKNGDYEEDIEGIKANTKYIVAAVGCTDYAPTTEIVTFEFTTGAAGEVGKWNYTVNFTDGTYKGYKVNAEIIPNDDTIDYCYEFIPEEYTQEEFTKQFYENLERMEQAGLDKESYIEFFGAYGPYTEEDCSVKPGHSYRIAAIPVDPETGDFLEAIFSKTIFVPVPEVSEETSVSVSCDKYYNGTEIAELGGEYYEYYRGYAVLTPDIESAGAGYIFGVFVDDEEEYTREDIIYSLLESGYMFPVEQIVPFNKDAVIYAVAADENGVFGPVFTKKFKLTEDGAAAAEEYFEQSTYSAGKAAAVKDGAGKTDAKKAAAEKIRKGWFGSAPRPFDAK